MKTLFVGQNSIHVKSIDSTNLYATELLRQIIPPEGTLIYTFEQYNGRGQRGNKWESEPNKNIALSFILYPVFLNAIQQFLLTKICSLAVADLMAEFLHLAGFEYAVKIKWPNDIYIEDKKIAGILIENNLRSTNLQSSIIGIGININQHTFSIEVGNAVSLKMLTNREFDLMTCAGRLCEFLEARYLQLKSGKISIIESEYLRKMYRFEEWSRFSSNNQLFDGKIVGVAFAGKLQIQLESGIVKEFDLKEIAFI